MSPGGTGYKTEPSGSNIDFCVQTYQSPQAGKLRVFRHDINKLLPNVK